MTPEASLAADLSGFGTTNAYLIGVFADAIIAD